MPISFGPHAWLLSQGGPPCALACLRMHQELIAAGKRMSFCSGRQQVCAPPGSAAAVDAASALHRAARALPQQHHVPVVPSRWVVLRPLQPQGMA